MVTDRRKHMRFDADINGEFEIRDTGIKGILTTDNFSRGGFRATVNSKVDLGQVLECEMTFPDTIMPFFSSGKIVWLKENRSGNNLRYDIGVLLEDMDSVEKQCLIDYCYKNWNNKRENKKTEFDLDF